jgi:release factor glutamine methyltransferase
LSETTLYDLKRAAERRIQASGSNSFKLDVEILTEYAFDLSRGRQFLEQSRVIEDAEIRRFNDLVMRRAAGEPIAYIVGEQEFWSLPFKVNEHTLIPRPDTETLIEASCKYIPDEELTILDIGTGSGCILLSILSEKPNASGIGIDQSEGAILVAQENAGALSLGERASFQVTDIFDDWAGERFDMVVSNPPYIPSGDLAGLMKDVKDYEPETALNGGSSGLIFYERIIALAPEILKEDGLLAFEVGIHQAEDVAAIMDDNGFFDIFLHEDLAGVQRVVTGFHGKR